MADAGGGQAPPPAGLLLPSAVALLCVLVVRAGMPWPGGRGDLLPLAAGAALLGLLSALLFDRRWRAVRRPIDRLARDLALPVAGQPLLIMVLSSPEPGDSPGVLSTVAWAATGCLTAGILLHGVWSAGDSARRRRTPGLSAALAAITLLVAGAALVSPATMAATCRLGFAAAVALLLLASAARLFLRDGGEATAARWLGTSLLLAGAAGLDLSFPGSPGDDQLVWNGLLLLGAVAAPVLGAAAESASLLQAERELAGRLERVRRRTELLLDALPVAVLTVDRHAHLCAANRRAAALLSPTGFEATVAHTPGWLNAFDPEDRARLETSIASLQQGPHRVVETVIRVEDREGGVHWLDAHLHSVLDPIDEEARVEIVATEITDLVLARRTGEARQARLALLSNLAQTVAGEVVGGRILDRFLELSAQAFGVTVLHLLEPLPTGDGLRVAATRGRAAGRLLLCREPIRGDNPCWLAFRDGIPRLVEVSEPLPPGTEAGPTFTPGTWHLVALPLLAAGQVIGVLALASPTAPEFATDDPDLLTQVGILLGGAIHLAQLVVQLEEQRALALEASRLKSEFLANTSHELRTPLTSILGFLRLVIDGAVEDPARQREFLSIAHDSAEKLLTIINDVLDLARIEAGRLEVFQAPVPVRQLIGEAERLFRHQMRSRSITFEVDDRAAGRAVWADAQRSLQILTNLLGNALKFSRSGGTVTLRTGVAEPEVVVVVEDNGIGIPPEELSRVFSPFHQVDGTTTRHYAGAGLGLTISRCLADLMGGSLLLESPGVDLGTRAELRLPLYEDSAPEQEPEAPARP